MGLVIVGALLVAFFLLYQAIHILFKGQFVLSYPRFAHPRPALRPIRRVCYALVFVFPVAGIFAILATALSKRGVLGIQTWVTTNFGMLLVSLCLSLVGTLVAVQPERMLRWTIREHPDLAREKSVIRMARLIGIGLVGLGLIILLML